MWNVKDLDKMRGKKFCKFNFKEHLYKTLWKCTSILPLLLPDIGYIYLHMSSSVKMPKCTTLLIALRIQTMIRCLTKTSLYLLQWWGRSSNENFLRHCLLQQVGQVSEEIQWDLVISGKKNYATISFVHTCWIKAG